MGITTAANVTAPSVAPTNTVISARVGPSAAPTNAISVTSPNPIASRFDDDFSQPSDDRDGAGAGTRADERVVGVANT